MLDKTKCVGCGTCARVCPKEAISRGPVGSSRRFPILEDIIPEVYDPKKCVFCGTCVYMCPFSALTLKKDGETIELDDIPIVAQKVVPKLEFEAKKVKSYNDIERVAKQYT
ncbi:MAG: 4Fe-4S binding protein, partial [Candidatus Thorarchaeota archaeon]